MRGKITVLCDNLVIEGADPIGPIGEYGFSVFIESEEGNYLFDTGGGFPVVHNSIYYRKDLSSVKKIFLSHGHFDHTGGLPFVLKLIQKNIEVIAHPHIFLNRFKVKKKERVYNGISFARGFLERLGARFILNKEWLQITDDIFLTGEIPRKISFEKKGDFSQRFAIVKRKTVPDLTMDDQALVITTNEGLLVILGCCHSGLINTLTYIIEKSGMGKIYTVIGGTHLGLLPQKQTEKTIEALKNFHIKKICPCHCTEMEASIKFYETFRDNFLLCGVGKVIEF